MRFDASTEFMMAINTDQQHPRVQTLDLDNNEHYTPVAAPLVAAAIPCNASPDLIPDGEAINRYSTVLQQRFADRFPQVEGMNATQWLTLVDRGQMAQMCRAVAGVVRATDRHTVRGAAPGMLNGKPEARREVESAYVRLRDVVQQTADDVRETLAVTWDI